jgi:hypothetical protein
MGRPRTINHSLTNFVYSRDAKEGRSDQRPAPYAFLRIWKKAPSGTWTVFLDLATSMQK